jgi:toxin YoeB
MEVVFTEKAMEDLLLWKKSGNTSVQNKISKIIQSIVVTPFEGIGKPEPLKHDLRGTWSRRINKEHRLVYETIGSKIVVHSLRGHYE